MDDDRDVADALKLALADAPAYRVVPGFQLWVRVPAEVSAQSCLEHFGVGWPLQPVEVFFRVVYWIYVELEWEARGLPNTINLGLQWSICRDMARPGQQVVRSDDKLEDRISVGVLAGLADLGPIPFS